MIRTVFFLALCLTQGYTINVIVDTTSPQLTYLRGIYSRRAGAVNGFPAYQSASVPQYQILAKPSNPPNQQIFFADGHVRAIGYLVPSPQQLTIFPPMLNQVFNVNDASGKSLGQVTLSDIAAICASFVTVTFNTPSFQSGNYYMTGAAQNNFPVYVTHINPFYSMKKEISSKTGNLEVFFYDNNGRAMGYITPSLSTLNCFGKGIGTTHFTVSGVNSGMPIAHGTFSTGITNPAPVGTAPAVTTVPPGTTVAPTTAPCKNKKNVVPYLKMLKAYKKIKTAAICEEKCSQYEPCQYWVWRNNKKVAKRQCKLFGVAWKKSKNTVAGEKC